MIDIYVYMPEHHCLLEFFTQSAKFNNTNIINVLGFHEYLPVIFDNMNFSLLSTTIHCVVLGKHEI